MLKHFMFYRLIVVADKQTVYDEFPIPLINRLEKHFLTSKTMLTEDQLKTSRSLQKWTGTMTAEALHLRYWISFNVMKRLQLYVMFAFFRLLPAFLDCFAFFCVHRIILLLYLYYIMYLSITDKHRRQKMLEKFSLVS